MKTQTGNYFALALVALALNLSFIQPATADSWGTSGSLTIARSAQTATLLLNGKILVTGGVVSGNIMDPNAIKTTSAELYDPITGTWTATGSMTNARAYHTATLLPNGKVMVVGGYSSIGSPLASAELYDPVTGTWTLTGAMNIGRFGHTATLLHDGQVLVAGGTNGVCLASSELYNPVTGMWALTGTMNTAHGNHTATLLPDGRVLVAGGYAISGITNSAELYDPAIKTWTITSPLNTARGNHTATLLPNGKVLVAGGYDGTNALSSAEVFDPSAGTWMATGGLNTGREFHSATLLPNGKVLVVGGNNYNRYNGSIFPSSAEVFDPSVGTWAVVSGFRIEHHTTTLLSGGQMLLAGGDYYGGSFNPGTVLYNSANGTWTASNPMNIGRYGHTGTLLPNGQVLVAGGVNYASGIMCVSNSAELYDPVAGTWTPTNTMNAARIYHTATLLPNGQVLVVGGADGHNQSLQSPISSAELYNPAIGTWTSTPAMSTVRMWHTATLLPNGKVLVAGGYDGTNNLSSAELFDPASGTWSTTGGLNFGRVNHTATLLPNGKVLVAGGLDNYEEFILSAELYDPASGTWSTTGALNSGRYAHTATLLPNGKVLVVGGQGASSSAELYDSTAKTWTQTSSMNFARYEHMATLLPNGKVLVAGGIVAANIAELYDPDTKTWATNYMKFSHIEDTATLLPSGKVLVAGSLVNAPAPTASTELFDVGLNYTNSWQPQIASITSPLNLGGSLVVTGAQFRGVSGGSSGNSQDSSADYPLVQLRRLDNEQMVFLLTTNWSTNSFTSLPVWNFPPGYALATVFVNGIQNTSSIVNISVPVPTPAALTNAAKLTNGSFQFGFTNNVGALFGVMATTNLSLPITNWTALGGVLEISPGQFQFTDSQATNGPKRFYRAFAP